MKTKSKYEKVLFIVTIICLCVSFLCKTIIGSYVESSNAELQRMKKEITTQSEINIGMQMKINELASLDNALNVADTYGLSYNNSNIRFIEE